MSEDISSKRRHWYEEKRVRVAVEYGVICDRRRLRLGKVLLAVGGSVASAEIRAEGTCAISGEHAHFLVARRVTYTEWSEPIAGQTVGGAASASQVPIVHQLTPRNTPVRMEP